MEVTVINWDDFMRGELAIFCTSKTEALQLLDIFDLRGLNTARQREILEETDANSGLRYSYRCGVGENHLYSARVYECDSWQWHKDHGFVSRVCKFAEIKDKESLVIDVQTIDDML